VVPDGTVIPDKTIVAHNFCDLLAEAAPLAPLKVQLVALLTRAASGAGVIAGPATATGVAMTAEAAKAASRAEVKETMFPESMHRSLVIVSPNSAYCMVLILQFDVATGFPELEQHVARNRTRSEPRVRGNLFPALPDPPLKTLSPSYNARRIHSMTCGEPCTMDLLVFNAQRYLGRVFFTSALCLGIASRKINAKGRTVKMLLLFPPIP
jgi:hypothetical protein